MTLFALLDPALVSSPEASTESVLAAHVLLGGAALTSLCSILAWLFRRLGTRAKAVTPDEMSRLEKRSPRLAAAIAVFSAIGWDLAQLAEALPALFHGRPMSHDAHASDSSPADPGAP